MSVPLYIAWNSAMSATAPPTPVATSASANTVKTMLQIAPSTTKKIRVVGWGYTLLAAPANNLYVELLTTDTFATVTGHVAAGVMPYNDTGSGASDVRYSATLTGYTASGEGTPTVARLLDFQLENGLYYKYRYELGNEPEVAAGGCLRIRATPSAAVASSMSCFIIWGE